MLLNPPKDVELAATAILNGLESGPLALLFVCTHNARRSQLAEAWAHHIFRGIPGIRIRSCGTERTQCHPSAAAALEASGWSVAQPQQGHYHVALEGTELELYSKTLDELPKGERVVAFMTCAEADEACPAILGAIARIPWRYTDPKVADGRPDELQTYLETSLVIRQDLERLRTQINHPSR